VLYTIEREDLKQIGFHAIDLIMYTENQFPDVKAYFDKECKSLARHPNIGSSGSVCLGDLRRDRNSSMPSLKEFMTMMRTCNLDSAYWGKSEPSRFFTGIKTGDWSGVSGLKVMKSF
jgi:hypothetical protein